MSSAAHTATLNRPRNQRSRPEENARASKATSAAPRRNPRRGTRGRESVASQSSHAATSIVSGQKTQSASRLANAVLRGSNGNRSHNQTGNKDHQGSSALSPLYLPQQSANVRQAPPALRPPHAALPGAVNPPHPSSHLVPHRPAPLPLPPAYAHDQAMRQLREDEIQRRRREMDTHRRVSPLVPAVPATRSSFFSRLWQPPAVPRHAVNSARPQKAPLGFTDRRREQATRRNKRLYLKLALGAQATAPISDEDLKDGLAQAITDSKGRAAKFAYTQARRKVEEEDLARIEASQGYFPMGATAR